MKTLVIVESPTKAKTISKFLGRDYTVKSSFGHLRDLPTKTLGVNIENDFKPEYVVNEDRAKTVKELEEAAKKTDKILFATDEDREGEAISWHLAHILGVKEKAAERIVFHEITKNALLEALKNPRGLDMKLVDAQQARRVLDRLVGYKLSPFLWKKVARGLSAGRVQSVAVRLIVEREREIQNFKPQEYWSIEGLFKADKNEISGKLYAIKGKALKKMSIKSKEQADKILKDLKNSSYIIEKIEQKEKKKNPLPPFTTSTLQQAANSRLGFSSKQTMRIAQQLYEGVKIHDKKQEGLITYMRTDSVNLSQKFIDEAGRFVSENYGKNYSLKKARVFANKSKNAQEAHEAIRPTDVNNTPSSIKAALTDQQYKLYNLIWKRAVATQMAQAKIKSTAIDIDSDNREYTFRVNGQVIAFDGFLKLYPDKTTENILPNLKEGQKVDCKKIDGNQHFTEPPARYSDATLVKAMETYGIGRPSTYAPTIATVEARGYVNRDDKKRLQPTDIAMLVNDILVEHFPKIVDYDFTAEMEDDLDKIALGKKQWQPIIKNFYLPFKKNLDMKDKELNKKELTEEKTDEKCEKCGSPMVIKTGRFGRFLACSNYPECKNTKNMDGDQGAPQIEEKTDEKCEKCGNQMVIKTGRFGKFLACSNYPECKTTKAISLGVKCPKCETGDLTERRTKRGKIFYGCNAYPNCDFALWNKPVNKKCPKCKSLLIYGNQKQYKCSDKECDYKEAI